MTLGNQTCRFSGGFGAVEYRCATHNSPLNQRSDSAEFDISIFLIPLLSTLTAVRVWLLSWTGAPAAKRGFFVVFMAAILLAARLFIHSNRRAKRL